MTDEITPETTTETPVAEPSLTDDLPLTIEETEPEALATAPVLEEEKPKEEPKKDLLSPKLAAIAKRERALTLKEKELKDTESRLHQLQAKEKLWKEDPLKFLLEGTTQDELRTILSSFARNETLPEPDEHTKALKKEIDELKTSKQKEQEELNKQQAAANHNQLMQAVGQFVYSEANAENFEFIKSHPKRAQEVYERFYFQTLEKNNFQNLSNDVLVELCSVTDDYLKEELTPVIERLSKKNQSQVKASEVKPSISTTEKKQSPKTLTNNLTSAANPKQNIVSANMTEEERMAAIEEKYKSVSLID